MPQRLLNTMMNAMWIDQLEKSYFRAELGRAHAVEEELAVPDDAAQRDRESS